MPDFSKSISVIIPAYNIEDLLEKCVDSVAAQDYPKDLLQIIVVDDGSSDNTVEICNKYSNIDTRVKLIKQEHKNSGNDYGKTIRKLTESIVSLSQSGNFNSSTKASKVK